MIFAIADIDPASAQRLTALRQLVAPFGIPPRAVHGHISLAAYTGGDEDGFVSTCRRILSRYGAFCVRYEGIEIFASTCAIVAAPQKEGPLDAIQRDIARAFPSELNQWTRREAWQPHTTLAYHPQADLAAIAQAMRTEFVPFSARVDRIEFSRVDEESHIEPLGFFALS